MQYQSDLLNRYPEKTANFVAYAERKSKSKKDHITVRGAMRINKGLGYNRTEDFLFALVTEGILTVEASGFDTQWNESVNHFYYVGGLKE